MTDAAGSDEFSRRALLGGAAAMTALLPGRLLATKIANPEILAPAGLYKGMVRSEDPERDPFRAYSFTGIRYGLAARFLAPTPLSSAEQVSGFGPVCPQQGDRYRPRSEDCLFLNVWTPRAEKSAGLPVMVYIHGGAYSTGSVTDPLNDGERLAARGDVVVVTVNHRLNALGYLYLARLDPRFPDSGNAGQLDLILALKWVKRNISSFGGDPGNVTVFGQSGGGAKIATLMAMPEAKGLFHKAITMSGQQVTASGPLNATKRAEAFLAKLNGADPATAPVEQLIAALAAIDPILGGGIYMGPVLDMQHLTRHPFWPDAAPQSLGIPMMLGNVIAETRAFFPPNHRIFEGLDWSNLASRTGPEMRVDINPEWVVAQFRQRYSSDSPEQIFHRVVTAGRSWRGQVEEAEARARASAPAFVYQLDFEQAKHADDIGLSFGTIPSPTSAQQAMSNRVMDVFVRFARTGNPGWPAYDLKTRSTMIFDTRSQVQNDPRKWERELFARVPYIQPGS
ncbi:MAG: carboxylesterase/lipase family protein [Sphingobium sp.]|nr:carboxylesterase/lipase family protein [Sphingobium sp.]